MAETLIVANPMGTDVKPYLSANNLSGLGLVTGALMKGTLLPPGRDLYMVPYVNQPGIGNVSVCKEAIQTKVSTFAPGHVVGRKIILFGYSEGCQGICWWAEQYGPTCPIDPLDMEIIMIGHAGSRYGGFAYERSVFDPVAYVHDVPLTVRYPTTVLARQYDGVGDFPQSDDLHDAYEAIAAPSMDMNVWTAAMQEMFAAVADPDSAKALWNAVLGMATIHNFYFNVTLADSNIRWHLEPDTQIRYGWSPSWPAAGFPQDYALQDAIESCYDRPCGPIPYLIPKGSTSWQAGAPAAVPSASVTGWWAELHAQFALALSPALSMGVRHYLPLALSVSPALGMVGAGRSVGAFQLAVTPALGMAAYRTLLALSVTPSLGMAAAARYAATIALSVTPALGMGAGERYGRAAALSVTPTLGMVGAVHTVYPSSTTYPSTTLYPTS